jgi:hypothetical protein
VKTNTSEATAALEQLRLAAIKHQFDFLSCDELPELAVKALQAGLDSQSLRLLAGELRPTWADCEPLFERALHDLGIHYQPRPEAGFALALHYARGIASGDLAPYQGARRIWLDVANEFINNPTIWDELRIFVCLVSDLDECPAERVNIEQEIRDQAKKLLGRHANKTT